MPPKYEKMKKAMQKEYGAKKGEQVAAATYNKFAKKYGLPTVGRGRR